MIFVFVFCTQHEFIAGVDVVPDEIEGVPLVVSEEFDREWGSVRWEDPIAVSESILYPMGVGSFEFSGFKVVLLSSCYCKAVGGEDDVFW